MHVIGGSVALICLILQVPNYWKVMEENFLNGLKFAAELAIGSYLLGCVLGLSVNLILVFFRKWSCWNYSKTFEAWPKVSVQSWKCYWFDWSKRYSIGQIWPKEDKGTCIFITEFFEEFIWCVLNYFASNTRMLFSQNVSIVSPHLLSL